MAKEFNKIVEAIKETTYAQDTYALTVLASLNPVARFIPLAQAGGGNLGSGKAVEYWLQRQKRIKSKAASTAAKAIDRVIANYGNASKLEWETIEAYTPLKRNIELNISKNEEFDIDNVGSAYEKAIQDMWTATAVERKERLFEAVFFSKTKAQSADSADTGAALYDEIAGKVEDIKLLSDDYKHGTDNVIIVLHPTVARLIGKEKANWESQTPSDIFGTGLTTRFSINGTPVVVDSTLNKKFLPKDGTAGTDEKQFAYLILDIESIAFKAEAEETPYDDTFQDERFVGKIFYDMQAVVDADRIEVAALPASLNKTATKKVHE